MSLSAMSRRRQAYTGQYAFVRGEYAIGDERVPYYAISMTVTEATRYLQLARDLAITDRQPVNFEELFQRAVDDERAAGPIRTYLLQPGSLKFFNSFTVVLLPVDPGNRNAVMETYEDDPSGPDDAPYEGMERNTIGPVLIDSLPNQEVGYLRWNTERAHAVILDGQHRFLALRKILDSAQRGLLSPNETRIPVLVLVLDPRAGFTPPTEQSSNVLLACRSIFVALNKHAVSVSKARTYLLDDQDLVSVTVRRLIASELGGDADSEASLKRIPLALVDWHSDQAKFDQSLYLTTVLSLYETVKTIYPPRCDDTDYEKLEEFVRDVTARVDPPAGLRWDEIELKKKIRAARLEERPFAFAPEEVAAISEAFADGIGQNLVRPLLQLKPYAELRERYAAAGFIGGDHELWLGSDNDTKKAIETRTGENPNTKANEISESVKADNLAFLVVFQRGLLLSAFGADQAREDLKEIWSVDSERFSVLNEWINRTNQRIVPKLKDPDFWIGTGIGPDRNINFTKVGTKGIKGLALLATLCPLEELKKEASAWASGLPRTEEDAPAWELVRATSIPYLESDRAYTDAGTPELRMAAYQWLAEQFSRISPGRVAGGVMAAIIREACMDLRKAVEAHIKKEVRATGGESPDRETLRQAAILLGARRLAALASMG
ncbi:DNA sulfur modification protein DndB [Streptomyces mutabilis]|uniref:DNA sulfur modification protein DndB n=1 Tax=Streptomyces TaxID=1883 RepID=UPI00177D8258|nr:DNA sulfur modification protein DndB [Streptomyces mutabilis]GGP99199.1 hypothetical protein GCM10010279_02470 [Streptomyces mutabilis]